MVATIGLVGLLLGLAGCPAPQGGAGAGSPPMVDNIKWWSDMSRASQEARDFKQPLVVDFGAEWCGFCKKLEKETFPAPEVQALKDKFVWARVDTDATPEPARKYNIEGLPTILVLDGNGKVLARLAGYLKPAEMAAFLLGALAKAPR